MSNVTDSVSAKMSTSKGVIHGYAAQAAVDSANQVLVASDVLGSGSEHAALLPTVAHAQPFMTDDTLITADAGYHSDANVAALRVQNRAALIADTQMRKRDERLAGQDKHMAKADRFGSESVQIDRRESREISFVGNCGNESCDSSWLSPRLGAGRPVYGVIGVGVLKCWR
jgi:Transposase DDE domain